jgi:hypothetical protein
VARDDLEEAMSDQRSLHNKELNNVYPYSEIVYVIISRRIKLARHVAHMREMINAQILDEKSE